MELETIAIAIISGLLGAILAFSGSFYIENKKIKDRLKTERAMKIFSPILRELSAHSWLIKKPLFLKLITKEWDNACNTYLFLASSFEIKNKLNNYYKEIKGNNLFLESLRYSIPEKFGKELYSAVNGTFITYQKKEPSEPENLLSLICSNIFIKKQQVLIENLLIKYSDNSFEINFEFFADELIKSFPKKEFLISNDEELTFNLRKLLKNRLDKTANEILSSKSFKSFVEDRKKIEKELSILSDFLVKKIQEQTID